MAPPAITTNGNAVSGVFGHLPTGGKRECFHWTRFRGTIGSVADGVIIGYEGIGYLTAQREALASPSGARGLPDHL